MALESNKPQGVVEKDKAFFSNYADIFKTEIRKIPTVKFISGHSLIFNKPSHMLLAYKRR